MRCKTSFLLVVLVLFASLCLAQDKPEYAISTIPVSLFENANTILQIDQKTVDVHAVNNAKVTYKVVTTILNKKSRGHEFFFRYDPERKLSKIKAKIYDAEGQLVRKIDKSEFEDYSAMSRGSLYEDSRVKYLKMLHDSYPYSVEVEYSMVTKNLMFFPNWGGPYYNTSIVNSQYRIQLPPSLSIRYKGLNTAVEPRIKSADGKKVYTWDFKNLTAIEYEPYSPPISQILPEILVTLDKFKVEDYHGSLSSWNEFGAFVYLLNKDRDQLSPEMKATVLDLIKDAQSDIEKINILYAYLQENMRYVSVQLGIGGWQTFDAQYVEENKYGDCKALTNFMKSMLATAGITAYCAYINGGKDREVYEDFPVASFNHVILNVPSEDCWLECTSKDKPVNYVGSFNQNRYALLVTEKESKLVKTPKLGAKDSFHKSTASIQLQADGQAKVTHELLLHGTKQDSWRFAKYNSSESELKEKFQESRALASFKIEFLDFEVHPTQAKTKIQYALHAPHYASKAGKRIFVPINQLTSFNGIPPINKDRIHPIELKSDYREEDFFTFILPEGYEVESMPKEKIDLDTPYGIYQVELVAKGNQLEYRRKLIIKPVNMPASTYTEFRDFYKTVSMTDNMKIVLVKKKT